MNDIGQPKVAIISSLTGGLGHYCAHLANPLSKHCFIKFITYPQIDQSGTTVKQITDSLVKYYIKWPRFDLDDTDPLTIVNIHEYLKTKAIDIINIHVGTTVKQKINYFTTFCSYSKTINHNKLIFTLHDVIPFENDKKLIKLLKVFYSLANAFSVGNENEKMKLMKYFDVHESKITVIHHGIYNLFDRHLYTEQIARSYLGLPGDKKIILFFGWLRKYKGFDYLIRATKQIMKKNNNFIIYVASGLKYTPKPLLEQYLQLIKKLELQDKIIMNLNYLDSLEVEAVFKASDIVLLPYTHVSQSGVMMMAFGFKKPVVITDKFNDKNWVENKAGLVAKSENTKDLTEKISTLLDNKELAKQFGEYGYDYSIKNFNWDTIAKKYFDLYKRLQSQ